MYRLNFEVFRDTFAGTQLCMNSPVDQTLLQLVHSLENEVKNWSEELKEEKEKVQQQLQIFDLAFKEINPRLLRLETGQLRLKRDHERFKTNQRRLESHSRDVEQRVIQCEGTPTFKKKGYYIWEARGVYVVCFLVSPSFVVINNTSNNGLLLLRLMDKKENVNIKYLRGQTSVEHVEKNGMIHRCGAAHRE